MSSEAQTQELEAIKSVLADLRQGKLDSSVPIVSDDPVLADIATSINALAAQLSEIHEVMADLANGTLDGEIPGRRNYLAAPLKSLQSRLSVLAWNAQQLLQDKVVSNIEYEGELYETINQLMRTITRQKMARHTDGDTEETMSSWKYHQILLALNKLQLLVLEVNSGGEIVYANEMANMFLGPVELLHAQEDGQEPDELLACLSELMHDRIGRQQEELYDNKRGAWFSITMEQIIFPNDETYYMYMVDDITLWKNKTITLERKASYDIMTGVYNKRGGLEMLRRLLESLAPDSRHVVAFVDLDGLKRANDAYGHKEGDFFIKSVASALVRSVRQTDAVIRYGGDEFVVFLLKCTTDNAQKILNAARQLLVEQAQKAGKPYAVGFSYGLTEFRNQPDSDLLKSIEAADQAMYLDKKQRHVLRE